MYLTGDSLATGPQGPQRLSNRSEGFSEVSGLAKKSRPDTHTCVRTHTHLCSMNLREYTHLWENAHMHMHLPCVHTQTRPCTHAYAHACTLFSLPPPGSQLRAVVHGRLCEGKSCYKGERPLSLSIFGMECRELGSQSTLPLLSHPLWSPLSSVHSTAARSAE